MLSNSSQIEENIAFIEEEVIISDDAMIFECFNLHFVNITYFLGLDPIFKQVSNYVELERQGRRHGSPTLYHNMQPYPFSVKNFSIIFNKI